jgi:hypothetical protein
LDAGGIAITGMFLTWRETGWKMFAQSRALPLFFHAAERDKTNKV